MQLKLRDDLLYFNINVIYRGQNVQTEVIVDTGSATTVLAADHLARIGIRPSLDDVLYTIRGVGGFEVVFSRYVTLQVEEFTLPDFEIEIGKMDYGFALNGILGMDFLLKAHAVIDLDAMELTFAKM